MERRSRDISDPVIVVATSEEEVTPESFAVWLDNRQKGAPVMTSVSAAETLAEIREFGES